MAEPQADGDPGPPLGVEAWPCPRMMAHTAVRDGSGNIWCCACEARWGEGHFLPEGHRLKA